MLPTQEQIGQSVQWYARERQAFDLWFQSNLQFAGVTADQRDLMLRAWYQRAMRDSGPPIRLG